MDDWAVDYFKRLSDPFGALQAVLLAAGIYFFLSFLKTSRGSGLVRGLVVAVAVIGLSLRWAAREFGMSELEHILTMNYGSVVLILVVLFQPELRRGVARLGEQNRLAKLVRGERPEAVTEVSAAVIALAKRRHGALIAFQRNTSLDAWTQNAIRIQSLVDRRLLQGIFQPGGALHDGAVIIDHDRLVAASCIFPLTESTELHASAGTRHRAALGLSEETDALTVAVSEETGEISVCESGTMQRDVDHERLAALLRDRLGIDAASQPSEQRRSAGLMARSMTFFQAVLFENLGRKTASLLLAGAWLYQAHENITRELSSSLWLSEAAAQAPNSIRLDLGSEDFHLRSPDQDMHFDVHISGPEEAIRLVESKALTGEWSKDDEFENGDPLEIADVSFFCGRDALDKRVRITWKKGHQPHITWDPTIAFSITLAPEHVPVQLTNWDPRLEFRADETTFSLSKVELRGPRAQIARLERAQREGSDEEPLDTRVESDSDHVALFQLVPLDASTTKQRLTLSQHLLDLGLVISAETPIEAEFTISATTWDMGTIEVELPLVDLSPTIASHAMPWELSSTLKAEFSIQTRAIMSSTEGPDSASSQEQRAAVRRFVREHLIVFVDTSSLAADETAATTTARVQWFWPPREWRTLLEAEIGEVLPKASVKLILKEPMDGNVLLLKSTPPTEVPTDSTDSTDRSGAPN